MADNVKKRDACIGVVGSIIVAGLVGAALGILIHEAYENITACSEKYPMLSASRACSTTAGKPVREYEEFETNLTAWIDSEKSAGDVEDASVYFRDLRAGPWFSINGNAGFIPASLFKVPVMIALLRASESDPKFLTQQLGFSGAYTGLTNVESQSQTIQPGKLYTADELLRKMIVYSDNASADLLKAYLDAADVNGDAMNTIYSDLGMIRARDQHVLTVKSYSALLRVLYNAQYLNPQMSEKAMELLRDSSYRDALVAGVPDGVQVAHKFGIRDVPGEEFKQFHDCGIVYYPHHPYILCVMTRGVDEQKNIAFLAEVSRRVYHEVDSQFMDDND